jgi:hypothetical protein
MKPPAASIVLSAVLASVAGAEVTARLRPAAEDGATEEGFLPAVLTVADPNGDLSGAVRGVSLRRLRGGPTLLYPTSIAPGTEQDVSVALPVVSVEESYVVRLLADEDASGAPLAELRVPLTVPKVDLVERARGALIDPAAYDGWLEDLPRWPGWLLRTVFLTAAVICVAMGAALFIRRPALRLAAVVCLVIAGALATAWVLSQCEVVSVRRSGALTILGCRRTTSLQRSPPLARPVYWSPRQMDADDMVYSPGRYATLTLHPNQVRLFRRAVPPPATATSPKAR